MRTKSRKILSYGLEENYHRNFEVHRHNSRCRYRRMGSIAHVVLSLDSLTSVLSQGGRLTAFFFLYLLSCDSPLFLFLCPICRKNISLYYTLWKKYLSLWRRRIRSNAEVRLQNVTAAPSAIEWGE